MSITNTEMADLFGGVKERHGDDVFHLAMLRDFVGAMLRKVEGAGSATREHLAYMLNACVDSHLALTDTPAQAVDAAARDLDRAWAVKEIIDALPE